MELRIEDRSLGTVDDRHVGTSEKAWLSSGRLQSIPLLPPVSAARVVLVAPHPDDEVLGAAGLMQHMQGTEISLVAVTDGEGSHPQAVEHRRDLRRLRVSESMRALSKLGLHSLNVIRLGMPDGAVTDHFDELVGNLTQLVAAGDLCVAPWRFDGHPDHEACGRAAAEAARSREARLLEYPIWAWHWLDPEDPRMPWDQCRRLPLSRRQAARKRWATHAFTSQIRPRGAEPGAMAVLPGPVLRRFWRPFEIFMESEAP
jgi:LmbE family N-acetylglucosaminyl deacetylase